MQGRVVVATGATSGIGEAAATRLAERGARIVFVARDPARAQATLAKLNKAAPGLEHRVHLADLSLMAETRRVAAEIATAEPRIDVLLNNAGAVFTRRMVTSEGLELTFALNHMAYFVLTQGLMERLTASAPARIVSTASAAHQGARLDFDDLQSSRSFSTMGAYGRSKLCNILFTRELARQLPASGRGRHPLRRECRRPARSDDAAGQATFHLARARRRDHRLSRRLPGGGGGQRALLRQVRPGHAILGGPRRRRRGPAVGGQRTAGGWDGALVSRLRSSQARFAASSELRIR
jgi:NAD(P)-dependent dehydrogenase (short-subunit alcohol dehydrogenase family)